MSSFHISRAGNGKLLRGREEAGRAMDPKLGRAGYASALGDEQLTAGIGKTLRLWNVYGAEAIGLKR